MPTAVLDCPPKNVFITQTRHFQGTSACGFVGHNFSFWLPQMRQASKALISLRGTTLLEERIFELLMTSTRSIHDEIELWFAASRILVGRKRLRED